MNSWLLGWGIALTAAVGILIGQGFIWSSVIDDHGGRLDDLEARPTVERAVEPDRCEKLWRAYEAASGRSLEHRTYAALQAGRCLR